MREGAAALSYLLVNDYRSQHSCGSFVLTYRHCLSAALLNIGHSGGAQPDRRVFRCDRCNNLPEPRVSAQRVKNRVKAKVKREPVVFFQHFWKPGERFILLSSPDPVEDILRGRHVPALAPFIVELFQSALSKSTHRLVESGADDN